MSCPCKATKKIEALTFNSNHMENKKKGLRKILSMIGSLLLSFFINLMIVIGFITITPIIILNQYNNNFREL